MGTFDQFNQGTGFNTGQAFLREPNVDVTVMGLACQEGSFTIKSFEAPSIPGRKATHKVKR